jgi:hypothetical protein
MFIDYLNIFSEVCSRSFVVPGVVAHSCNPSYSGGRDQEDRGSKLPGQIVQETLSKKPITKNGGLVEWLKV